MVFACLAKGEKRSIASCNDCRDTVVRIAFLAGFENNLLVDFGYSGGGEDER